MSTIVPFNYIGENSEATPGLFNSPLSAISATLANLNSNSGSGLTMSILSDVSTGGGVYTAGPSNLSGAVTIHANSNASDYLAFQDSSNQRSNYLLGSHAGGTADGLNLYDTSGNTMIVGFSKQSTRFYSPVVGTFLDTGGQFINVKAYGAMGDGITDDSAAIISAFSAAHAVGAARIYVPDGTYIVNPVNTMYVPPGSILEMSGAATFQLAANAKITPANGKYYIFGASLGSPWGSGDDVELVNFNYNGNGGSNQTKVITAFLGFKANNLSFFGPSVVSSTGEAFVVTDCANLYIQDSFISGCGRTGDHTTARPGMAIVCDVANTDPHYSSNNRIAFGYVAHCGLDGIIFNATDSSIYGLYSFNNGFDIKPPNGGAAGIFYTSNGSEFQHNVVIDSCSCISNSGNGIDSAPNQSTISSVRIINCECSNNGLSGIIVDAVSQVWIENNRCYNNHQIGSTGTTSNQLHMTGGIVAAVNFSADALWIRRNKCYDSQTPQTQHFGLQLGGTSTGTLSNIIVEDNDFSSNLSDGIGTEYSLQPAEFVNTGFGSFRRNMGYTPTVTSLTASQTKVPFISDLITLTLSSATSVLGITNGRYGDTVTLAVTNGNANFKASGGNLILSGNADYAAAGGTTIHFQYDGTNWREMGRQGTTGFAQNLILAASGATIQSASSLSVTGGLNLSKGILAAATIDASAGGFRGPDGTAAGGAFRYRSEDGLGWYRSGSSTMALSYGTLNLATNAARLSMRTLAASSVTVSAAKTNVATNEVVFTVGGASGASLVISSGGTAYIFNSALSAALA